VNVVRTRLGLALAAVVAAAVLGGLVPHSVATDVVATARPTIAILEEPLSVPLSCTDAVCGKGSPAPAAPTPAVVLAAVIAAAVITALAVLTLRHRRTHAAPQHAGVRNGLFRPPRFS
jgi:hypothetical protein